jgi:transposase
MNIKTSVQQRQRFYELHQQGKTYAEIAEQAGVSLMCVRYWCRRHKKSQGHAISHPRKKQGLLVRFDALVRYALLRLKLEHPGCGPNRLRSKMKKRPSLLGRKLPGEAEIGRYLHQWKRFWRKPSKKPSAGRAEQPVRVHQRWQMDFKVQIHLLDGSWVSLFTVRDPLGEAVMGAFLYVTGKRSRVRWVDARAVLRRCFQLWGTLPEEVQTDGESTLVSAHKNDFPSLFTLWLVGLGIRHLVITKVTQNAEVERCHRTIYEYGLLGNEDQSPEQLQHTLDQASYELNYELPSQAEGCAGQPPILAHPELLAKPRPYNPAEEHRLFDLKRVDQYLQQFVWVHRVSENGQVAIGPYHARYSVSRAYAKQDVEVRFDPADRHFVFSPVGQADVIIRRCPAKHLQAVDLMGQETFPIGPGFQQLALPLFDHRGNLLMSS